MIVWGVASLALGLLLRRMIRGPLFHNKWRSQVAQSTRKWPCQVSCLSCVMYGAVVAGVTNALTPTRR